MNLISKETMDDILEHYDEKHHELIKHQLDSMSKLISSFRSEYQTDKSFQRGFDIVFENIISGSFILKDKEE